MKVLGYGEDTLTLWALRDRIKKILDKLGDNSDVSRCKVIYRPSFGRRGGAASPQFGEFDFILLSDTTIYLGESKWDQSSEVRGAKEGVLKVRDEQLLRHQVFQVYVQAWFSCPESDWQELAKYVHDQFKSEKIDKRVPNKGTRLADNLWAILQGIGVHFDSQPSIKNVLLYLHRGPQTKVNKASDGFELVMIDYSQIAKDGFIEFTL